MNKVFYLLFLAGIMIETSPSSYWAWCACRTRFFMRRNLGKFGDEKALRTYGKAGTHIYMLIQAAEAEKYFTSVERFYPISMLLGLLAIFISFKNSGTIVVVVLTVIVLCFIIYYFNAHIKNKK